MKCGNLISVVNGWQCEKCGVTANSTNEVWEKQKKCKGKPDKK